jgi:hypothetical protein
VWPGKGQPRAVKEYSAVSDLYASGNKLTYGSIREEIVSSNIDNITLKCEKTLKPSLFFDFSEIDRYNEIG